CKVRLWATIFLRGQRRIKLKWLIGTVVSSGPRGEGSGIIRTAHPVRCPSCGELPIFKVQSHGVRASAHTARSLVTHTAYRQMQARRLKKVLKSEQFFLALLGERKSLGVQRSSACQPGEAARATRLSQLAAEASLGMRQSPRGERLTDPTLG